MTLEEFVKSCDEGWFIDYDGYGRYATADQQTNISIYPSYVTNGAYLKNFSHVIWFNK